MSKTLSTEKTGEVSIPACGFGRRIKHYAGSLGDVS